MAETHILSVLLYLLTTLHIPNCSVRYPVHKRRKGRDAHVRFTRRIERRLTVLGVKKIKHEFQYYFFANDQCVKVNHRGKTG